MNRCSGGNGIVMTNLRYMNSNSFDPSMLIGNGSNCNVQGNVSNCNGGGGGSLLTNPNFSTTISNSNLIGSTTQTFSNSLLTTNDCQGMETSSQPQAVRQSCACFCGGINQSTCVCSNLPVVGRIEQNGDWNADGDQVPVKVTLTNYLSDPIDCYVKDCLCGNIMFNNQIGPGDTTTIDNVSAKTSLIPTPNQEWVRSPFIIYYARRNDPQYQLVQKYFTWLLTRKIFLPSIDAFFMTTSGTSTILVVGFDNDNAKRSVPVNKVTISLRGNPSVFTEIQPLTTAPALNPPALGTIRFPVSRFFPMQTTASGITYIMDLLTVPVMMQQVPGSNWTAFQITGVGLVTTTEKISLTVSGDVNAEKQIGIN